MQRYFERIAGVGSDNYIYVWKSKGFSDEKILHLIIVSLQN